MDRTQVLELMGTLKLYGMRSAYDEVMSQAAQSAPGRVSAHGKNNAGNELNTG